MSGPFADVNSEHPLRPYYVAPALDDSLFSDLSLASKGGAPSSSSVATLPNRYARFDELQTFLEDDGYHNSPSGPLRGFIGTSILGFASTGLVQPFEVAKTLLQVQWIPHYDSDLLAQSETLYEQDGQVDPDAVSDEELSDENEAEAYFADYVARPKPTFEPSRTLTVKRPKDAAGYLMRTSIYDEATKPDYVLPFVVTGGVWDMLRAISRWKGEGWMSLWKGQFTAFSIDTLASTIQPFLQSLLLSAFASPASLPNLPLVHSPQPTIPLMLGMTSHLVTGIVLSPLDLIRTRLIVQSRQPKHQAYTGPVDAFTKIVEQEGGLSTMYFHSNLIIPTILDNLFRPLLHLATPLIIERVCGVALSDNPIAYCLLEFVVGATSLAVTLPIETVRKRLQIQSRMPLTSNNKAQRPLRPCVETRPVPYAGVVEAIYRILTEERSSLPPSVAARQRRRPSTLSRRQSAAERKEEDLTIEEASTSSILGGIRQLYRGYGMALSAQAIVLLLQLVTGRDRESTTWAEV